MNAPLRLLCLISEDAPGSPADAARIAQLASDAACLAIEREFVRAATRAECSALNLPRRAVAIVGHGELTLTLRYAFVRRPPRYAQLPPEARLAAVKRSRTLARNVVWRTNNGALEPVWPGGRA